ncbi:MAG TPA: helix-turn-helix domain-containing protein [Pseudonocardiaceae bacterium]|jgi:AcrR family transcriptional regulator|nr:helix-turn-helix domain-containing protein [Pseudonocardiaceae bacterium]
MSETTQSAKPMRADARRNCEKIIAVAREVFAEHGTDAPLDEIAKRAQVGAGTLYRHFANRDALIEAVYRSEIVGLSTRAHELAEQHSPQVALEEWIRLQLRFITEQHGLAAALKVAIDKDSETFGYCRTVMREAAGEILQPLQESGDIRADITPADLLRLAHGIGVVSENLPKDEQDRLLSVLINGLQPEKS